MNWTCFDFPMWWAVQCQCSAVQCSAELHNDIVQFIGELCPVLGQTGAADWVGGWRCSRACRPLFNFLLPFLVLMSTKVTSKKGVLQVKVCLTPGLTSCPSMSSYCVTCRLSSLLSLSTIRPLLSWARDWHWLSTSHCTCTPLYTTVHHCTLVPNCTELNSEAGLARQGNHLLMRWSWAGAVNVSLGTIRPGLRTEDQQTGTDGGNKILVTHSHTPHLSGCLEGGW